MATLYDNLLLSKALSNNNVKIFYTSFKKNNNILITDYNSNGIFNFEVKKLILGIEKILLLKKKAPSYYFKYHQAIIKRSIYREKHIN